MLNVKKVLSMILEDLTRSTADYSSTYGTVRALKQSGMVTLQIDGTTTSISKNQWTTLATIGTDYRPARTMYSNILNNTASDGSKVSVILRVQNTGLVSAWCFTGYPTNCQLLGLITYPAANRGG